MYQVFCLVLGLAQGCTQSELSVSFNIGQGLHSIVKNEDVGSLCIGMVPNTEPQRDVKHGTQIHPTSCSNLQSNLPYIFPTPCQISLPTASQPKPPSSKLMKKRGAHQHLDRHRRIAIHQHFLPFPYHIETDLQACTLHLHLPCLLQHRPFACTPYHPWVPCMHHHHQHVHRHRPQVG